MLNSNWSLEDMEKHLPAAMKNAIAKKHVKFYNVDAVKVAQEVGLGGRINMIMQTAFFKLANVMDFEQAIAYLKDGIKKAYGKKGDKIVNMNIAAVDKGMSAVEAINYPESWATTTEGAVVSHPNDDDYVAGMVRPILAQQIGRASCRERV